METKSEKQHQQKKTEILQGFSELIADNGLENVSMSKLAKYLNIPTSLIFYYFKNKGELVEEVVDYVLAVCQKESIFPLDLETGQDQKTQFLDYLCNLFLEHESTDSYHIRAYYVCYNLALRDEKAKEKFYLHQEQLRQDFKEKLTYFEKCGVVKTPNLDEAAEILFCMINGLTDMVDFIDDEEREMRIAKRNMQLFLDYLQFDEKII